VSKRARTTLPIVQRGPDRSRRQLDTRRGKALCDLGLQDDGDDGRVENRHDGPENHEDTGFDDCRLKVAVVGQRVSSTGGMTSSPFGYDL
jgi:hypothetical protein